MNLNLKTTFRLTLIGLAASALVACASHPPPPPPGPPPPPASAPAPPEAEAPPPQSAGPIPGSAQDFVINVGERIYFDFDKYDLRADAVPILNAQAAWLQRYADVQVRIEGNCDERGTREYNFALGARRAASVRDYLVAHGVTGGRITTVSYGKEKPIDPGTDDQALSRNRNAHTAITQDPRG